MKYNAILSKVSCYSKRIYSDCIKRVLDLIISLISLLLVSPILITISIMIILDSEGPILYRQQRLGKNKQEFIILKFRTMVSNADKIGSSSTQKNDSRITKIGKVLRKYSLDELPQLINVAKGEMSIVGYRPGLKQNYRKEDLESEIFTVKPGITGYAQIMGRSSLLPKEKRKLEKKYVKDISFITDIKIILKTIKVTIIGSSAY